MCIVNLLTDVFVLQSSLQGELQAYPQTRLGRQWTYRTGSAPAGLCDNPATVDDNVIFNIQLKHYLLIYFNKSVHYQ